MKDLTTGKEGKLIWQFALPMLLGNVFQQLYNVVDSIIVGNFLGKEALSAVGASFPVIFVLISLIIGVASGSGIIISQYFGAKEYRKVKLTIDTMYIFLFFASFVIAGAGILLSESIFRLIDLPENIIPEAKKYLNVFLMGTIVMFGYNGTSAILRGLGDSKTPLYFLILSTIINIGLDLLFVIVFGWGVESVALASVIAQGIAFLTAVIYLNKTHKLIKISIPNMKFDRTIFKHSLRIGLPSGLQHMFVSMGMVALYRIVNAYGTDTIAAYSVVGRIDSFAAMPAMNFSVALSIFVGQNIGANKLNRVRKGLISTLLIVGLISVIFSIVNMVFARQLMMMFTPEEEVIRIGIEYLLIVSGFYLIFTTMFSFNAVFRGAGDTIFPMFVSLFALWIIRIPVSWVLSEKLGTIGIWWGIPIAWFGGMMAAIIYYFTGYWKKKALIKHSEKEKTPNPSNKSNPETGDS